MRTGRCFALLLCGLTLTWAGEGTLVARYGFAGADVGKDELGNHDLTCTGGGRIASPAGPGVVFAGDGGLELAAERCPDFRAGFGLDFRLRLDSLEGPMVIAARDGQFLLRLDPEREQGSLSFFVRDHNWEPRLRGPRLEAGKWYHVRAGWNGRQMVLQVDDSVARQARRVRQGTSPQPLQFGKGLEWGGPLQGALAALQIHAPAPDDWFEAEGEERLAACPVELFEVDNAYPRAGRPETVNLWLRADKALPGGTVTLELGAGLRLAGDEASRAVPALVAGETVEWTWRVQADQPGTYAIAVADGAGAVARRQVVFQPPAAWGRHDYVPPPEPVRTEVLVGAQMCPLWKEGARRSVWQPIVPWYDRKPVLGWYDEGNPEVTDWEIKWCLDHGISFFVYCWYRANQGGPVDQRLGHAIHEGLFRARYRDQFKFAIMWENQQKGSSGVASEEDFLENLLPFWIENYFRHPSYLVLDGKPLLYIYRPEYLVNDLGSVALARQALDKARAACVAAGFKGLILLGEYRGSDPNHLKQLVELGMDHSFAYCWPLPGSPASAKAVDMQEEIWQGRREMGVIPEQINVSMGWDSRPWHPSSSIWRHTPADFAEACRRALAATKQYPEGSISRRVVLLDNWNEFGEGHYLMPHREYGFGYLEAVREAFAPDAPKRKQDVTPADVGLGPYDSLYRQARSEERRFRVLLAAVPATPVREEGLVAFWTFDESPEAEVAMDQTGNGMGARLRQARRAPGIRGQALLCDGGIGQVLPDPRIFPPSLTFACWVYAEQEGQSDRWFANSIYGGTTDAGYRFGLSGGQLTWGVPETAWSHHLRASEPLPAGRWVHVAATADDKAMRIYQDGREVAYTSRTLPVREPENRPLTLGNFEGQHRAHFQGLLDEVRIYDRILTPEQIAELARP
ncbi:MAG: LamG-like jellyroll fold domain-containing protein [Lentisphaeria bacterium]|jgi:hypothetical protein|nr:LamG-like jellyroll fold domain-containing protein [Lentisphaeria bacterium]